jgi:hypothetical protein
LARPTALASAQVSLADFQSAKLTFPVPAAADASLDDSAPIVDRSLEMKSNIIQIKDVYFSNMINKVKKHKYFAQIPIWSNYFNFCIY